MSQRQFNPRSFFKKLHPDIAHNLLGQLNLLDAIDEAASDADPEQDRTYFAWKRVSAKIRKVSDRDLRRINDLCCNKGRLYVERELEAALSRSPKLLEQAREMAHYDAAATLYLEAPSHFERAHSDLMIDDVTYRVKRQAKDDREIRISDNRKLRMKALVEDFYIESGKGRRLVQVEDHEDDERYALFVYYEERLKYEDSFDEAGLLISDTRKPVELAMVVYIKATGVLTVHVRTKALRNKLILLFGDLYFGDPTFFETTCADEFDLSPLQDRAFEFETRAGDGIASVLVTEVTLMRPKKDISVMTLQCPNGHVAAIDAAGIPLATATFQAAKLEVRPDGGSRKRKRTICLSLPDRWNLKDTHLDRMLTGCVERWGFMKKKDAGDDKRDADAMDNARELGELFRSRVAARYDEGSASLAH